MNLLLIIISRQVIISFVLRYNKMSIRVSKKAQSVKVGYGKGWKVNKLMPRSQSRPKSFMAEPETINSINSRIELKMLNRDRYFIMAQLNSYRYYVEFTSRGFVDQFLIDMLNDIDIRIKLIKQSLHVYFRQEIQVVTYEAEEYPKQYINTKMDFDIEDRKKFIETISYYNNEFLELNLCKISHTMGTADYMFEKYIKQKLIMYSIKIYNFEKSESLKVFEIINHLYAVFEQLLLRHDEDTATVNLLCYAIRKNIIQ